MSVYVCIHVGLRMYICIYVCVCICVHVRMYICTNMYMYVYLCMYVRTYVCMYACVRTLCLCLCEHVCVCVCVCVWFSNIVLVHFTICLTPNSRLMFLAGVSLIIHSFIHSLCPTYMQLTITNCCTMYHI